MLILGLQGSPRSTGSSNHILTLFMETAEKAGARTITLDVTRKNIVPCKEFLACEKKGFCPIKDDILDEIYPLIRKADVVVISTPIFFYNMTAQLKTVVDRCQLFWARKYMLKLTDPKAPMRQGFLLAVGASRGKRLFDGLDLTARYFFDAIDADYAGKLTFPGIQSPQAMQEHPTARREVEACVTELLAPFTGRKRVLFACRDGGCYSQIAAAFLQHAAGDRFSVHCGGAVPAPEIDPQTSDVMAEKGIDMKFRMPESVEAVMAEESPELVITLGEGVDISARSGTAMRHWDLPDLSGKDMDFKREIRDVIEKKTRQLIDETD